MDAPLPLAFVVLFVYLFKGVYVSTMVIYALDRQILKHRKANMNIARIVNAVNVTLYCNVTMIAIISGSQISTVNNLKIFTSHVYLCIVSFCLSLSLGLLFGHAFSVGQVS